MQPEDVLQAQAKPTTGSGTSPRTTTTPKVTMSYGT